MEVKDMAEILRKRFPDDVYVETAKEQAEQLKKSAKNNIEKYRRRYNSIQSFKDRTAYFNDTLVHMENAYTKFIKELNQHPLPYDFWIDEHVLEQMKTYGFRATISLHMTTGKIYEG